MRRRGGDRTVCVEVDGELSRGDAVTPSNPPPATFGGEWWEPGGCVRACARDQHASATLPEDASAQRHAHVYIQTARVRALPIQRASCRRLVTADAKTKFFGEKKVEVSHSEDRGAMLEDDTQK